MTLKNCGTCADSNAPFDSAACQDCGGFSNWTDGRALAPVEPLDPAIAKALSPTAQGPTPGSTLGCPDCAHVDSHGNQPPCADCRPSPVKGPHWTSNNPAVLVSSGRRTCSGCQDNAKSVLVEPCQTCFPDLEKPSWSPRETPKEVIPIVNVPKPAPWPEPPLPAPAYFTVPAELTRPMMLAVRDHPTTSASDTESWHAKLGWLICAWDVLKEFRVSPAPIDSTPGISVGESSFETWFASRSNESLEGGRKQLARDAYAAGMGDPRVTYRR